VLAPAKDAVVYNRDSMSIIDRFGRPNRETAGLEQIRSITEVLREGGQQATAFEDDKGGIDHLEEFMPRVRAGGRPGMVMNPSDGIQRQARSPTFPALSGCSAFGTFATLQAKRAAVLTAPPHLGAAAGATCLRFGAVLAS